MLMLCGRHVTGFLQSLQDFLFIITQVRIYDVYCIKQKGYRYVP